MHVWARIGVVRLWGRIRPETNDTDTDTDTDSLASDSDKLGPSFTHTDSDWDTKQNTPVTNAIEVAIAIFFSLAHGGILGP